MTSMSEQYLYLYSDKSALFFIQLLPCTFFQNWIKYIFLMRKALYDLQLYTSVSTKPESHSPSEIIFPWFFFLNDMVIKKQHKRDSFLTEI